MIDEEISWGKKKESNANKDHADYSKNHLFARRFIINYEKNPTHRMTLKILDSHHLKEAILSISYIPPKLSKFPNFSCPVCLHQKHSDFVAEFRRKFNEYNAMAGKINRKLDDLGLKLLL